MKRIGVVVSLLLVCVLYLAACGGSGAGQNFGEVIDTWRANTSKPDPTQLVSYENGQFGDTLGFNVSAYPNSASLSASKFFALDGWFGQIDYLTADDRTLVLRVAETGGRDLTTTYQEMHSASDSTRTVNGIEVRTRNSDAGCSMVTWERDGFQFLVHSNFMQGEAPQAEIDQLVNETRAEMVEP